jgi:SAM-dependent methyltransferase
MVTIMPQSPSSAPDYGLDAPTVVRNLAIGAIACIAASLLLFSAARTINGPLATVLLLWGAFAGASMGIVALLMARSSRIGKLKERDHLLDSLGLAGNEVVLDVGCGRGLLVVGAATRLATGKVIGLDLWNPRDQQGATPETLAAKARIEGVSHRLEVKTGDMQDIPLPDSSVDVVVSSLAIHNIESRAGRAQAVREIARVLRPGGRVALLDFQATAEYQASLRSLGWQDVERSPLRWGMFPPIRIVKGTKPTVSTGAA